MNHLKLFEENIENFEKYDYVKISRRSYSYEDLSPTIKIINKIKDRIGIYYKVQGIDNKTNKLRILSLDEYELERKASPKEIEEYKTKINAIKYNL